MPGRGTWQCALPAGPRAGRDGHHELERQSSIRAGPRKGEVYARGVLRHTKHEHEDFDLGTIRWHLVVHNIQGASYTLSGGGLLHNSTNLEPVIRLFRGRLDGRPQSVSKAR